MAISTRAVTIISDRTEFSCRLVRAFPSGGNGSGDRDIAWEKIRQRRFRVIRSR